MKPAWPERIVFGRAGASLEKSPEHGAPGEAESDKVLGQARKQPKNASCGPECPCSGQRPADPCRTTLCGNADRLGWSIAMQVREVGSGGTAASSRGLREVTARRRKSTWCIVGTCGKDPGRPAGHLPATQRPLRGWSVLAKSWTSRQNRSSPASLFRPRPIDSQFGDVKLRTRQVLRCADQSIRLK